MPRLQLSRPIYTLLIALIMVSPASG